MMELFTHNPRREQSGRILEEFAQPCARISVAIHMVDVVVMDMVARNGLKLCAAVTVAG